MGSPKRKSSSVGGSKRTREDQDGQREMKRSKECTSESTEPVYASSEQDSQQQTDAEATRLTALGGVSKAPSRLDSLEEWKRVMVGFIVFFILLLIFVHLHYINF